MNEEQTKKLEKIVAERHPGKTLAGAMDDGAKYILAEEQIDRAPYCSNWRHAETGELVSPPLETEPTVLALDYHKYWATGSKDLDEAIEKIEGLVTYLKKMNDDPRITAKPSDWPWVEVSGPMSAMKDYFASDYIDELWAEQCEGEDDDEDNEDIEETP